MSMPFYHSGFSSRYLLLHVNMALNKIVKQQEEIWTKLHRRLTSLDFDVTNVFPARVSSFMDHSAKAVSSCSGYLLSCIISACAFLIARKSTLQMPSGHIQNTNIFHVLTGPPSSGKSQALKLAAMDPIKQIAEDKDFPDPIIQKSTVSGLTKKLSENKQGFLISAEIFDSLSRLLKSENETNDSAFLCELFSGEQFSLNYATKNETNISALTPFVILGCIQMFPLAKLLVMLNQGQGLIDRFLIHVPLCLRPTPEESRHSKRTLEDLPSCPTFLTIMSAISDITTTSYTFCEDSANYLQEMETEFITEMNEAISTGTVPPKSKKIDMIARVSLCLHVFCDITQQLLDSVDSMRSPDSQIPMAAVQGAVYFVNFCETQKDIFLQVRQQPLVEDIQRAICLFPGRAITMRAFKCSGPRPLRKICEKEFSAALRELNDFGKVIKVKVPRTKPITVFLKKVPDEVTAWTLFSKESYIAQFNKPSHSRITENIRSAVIESEHLVETYFDSTD
ncbi:uncharacterized protein [Apostichopus japonicus]|uniref:uncharacterized protein isoform X2 n=1 Tax=Stichopus japonicus TaxID=307972 RepID=UPI003AB61081